VIKTPHGISNAAHEPAAEITPRRCLLEVFGFLCFWGDSKICRADGASTAESHISDCRFLITLPIPPCKLKLAVQAKCCNNRQINPKPRGESVHRMKHFIEVNRLSGERLRPELNYTRYELYVKHYLHESKYFSKLNFFISPRKKDVKKPDKRI
jgi:hypothetical protein